MSTEMMGAALPGALMEWVAQGHDKVEADMLQYEQVKCEVFHHYGPGIYIREVHLKADTFAVGHHQKMEHTNIMLKGRVVMVEPDGTTKELVAPLMFVGKPGRKMGYIVEDTVWQNIYATQERDVEKLEATFLDKSPHWQEVEAARHAVAYAQHCGDRDSYQRVIEDCGFTPEQIKAQVENEDDQIPMPVGSWKVKVGVSAIHGKGVFLTSDALRGDRLGPARIGGMRTPLGRYTNHSEHPNATMFMLPNGDIDLVAMHAISGCHGGTDGDEVTIDYRHALNLSRRRLT